MNPIHKTTFDELYNTMNTVCKKVDIQFAITRLKNKGNKIYDGFDNYKEFLHHVETTAIREAAKELNLGETTVRDRWKIMSLPLPVYDAIETDTISFSKLKPLTTINFDMENEKDVELAQKIVDEIQRSEERRVGERV